MTEASNTLALVADIGGTNARFALTDIATAHPVLSHSLSLPAADFASLQHAIEHYLARVGAKPRLASLAVACPVLGDEPATQSYGNINGEDLPKSYFEYGKQTLLGFSYKF